MVVALQVALAVAASPAVVGLVRQVHARLEGRVGAGVGQPWRDLRKLAAKEPLRAPGASPVQWLAPLVLLVSSLLLAALVPLLSVEGLPLVPGDLFVVVSVLLAGTVALALLGLDSGTAFGGMGSSRHMMIAALVEPTVLVAVYAISVPTGSSALGPIVAARLASPDSVVAPASLLAVVALVVAVLAETGRLPVDNPATHLELTMVHEAMVLETSGRDLAWVELGAWVRLSVLVALVANLLAPWGVAREATPLALAVAALALAGKVGALAVVLGVGEVMLAKVRLFRVPELLAGSFVLAFLAVTASYVIG